MSRWHPPHPRHLALLAFLAVAHTWPLSIAPASRSLNGNADAQTFEWSLSWIAHAIAHQPTRLFDGNVFAPEPRVLAYADPLFVPGLIGAPIRWLGGSPVLTFNLVQIAGLMLTAWAGWFVVWRWTGSAAAALTSGALMAFNVHLLARLPHPAAAYSWSLPLTLFLADRLLDSPSRRNAIGLVLTIAATAATSIYSLTFATLIAGLVALVGLRHWRGALAIAGSVCLGVLVASPVLWPYALLARAGVRRPLEIMSGVPASAYVTGISRADAWLTGATTVDEGKVLFAGVIALALAGIGAVSMWRTPAAPEDPTVTRRRLVTLTAIAGVAVLLSFGPSTAIYRWAYEWLLPLRGLRALGRFGYLYLVVVALLAGVGVAWLERRAPTERTARLIVVAALIGVSLEAWTGPVHTQPFARVPPLYTLLRDMKGPVMLVEVPFFPPEEVFRNGEYMLNATAHWRPVMNGYSGLIPDSYRARTQWFWFFPRDWAIDAMIKEGATHVMVHLDQLDDHDRSDIAETLPARTDLRLIASDGLGHRLYEVRR